VQRITRSIVAATCAICERSILTGERVVRFAPHAGAELVDVCPLCQDLALEYGWLREGSPTTPLVPTEPRRRRRSFVDLLMGTREAPVEPTVSEPILRRLSETEAAIVEAAELFNASAFRRTIGGIAKSLGAPRVSIVPLSGVNTEAVITIAWDLSWYQYRVSFDSAQPVRLAERGYELAEVDGMFASWNAKLSQDGRLIPQIEPL
jgi:hypothetical protein